LVNFVESIRKVFVAVAWASITSLARVKCKKRATTWLIQ